MERLAIFQGNAAPVCGRMGPGFVSVKTGPDCPSGSVFRRGAWEFFGAIFWHFSTQNSVDLLDQFHKAVRVFFLRGLFAEALPTFIIAT